MKYQKSMETQQLVEVHEQKKDTTIFTDIPIDTKHKVDNLNTIGWTDPATPNPQKALLWLKSLNHTVFIYPEDTYDPLKPPSCVFVPDTAVLNKLIEAVARTPDNKDLLYAKFSDQKQPRPQWMIDYDLEKA